MESPRHLLRRLFDAAVAAADPARAVPAHLPPRPSGRILVTGGGKASAAMARAAEQAWGTLEGVVATRHGHAVPCAGVEIVEAGHPQPDEHGAAAARRMLDRAAELGEGDLMLALVSGGGSALLTLPPPGVTLAEMAAVNAALLNSGADITAINTVRRHLSQSAGGRLAAAAWPARTLAIALSDVAGDDPIAIASGPTVADPTTLADARAVMARHAIVPPPSIAAWLERAEAETPKPGDGRLSRSDYVLAGSGRLALDAAASLAEQAGHAVLDLGDAVAGEAREVAAAHAALVRTMAARGVPLCILSGGETSVTVRGGGRGGRNGEYALALALALDGLAGVHALAADTDGIDGSEDNAGAFIAPDSLARARAAGLDAAAHLARNDSWTLFHTLGDLLVTGPTRTNVNDFRAILVNDEGGNDAEG
jgi:hydroxypyruvate reductase